jgi:ribosomal protein L44E
MKQTYCTRCKTNVGIINTKYIKLANSRLAIEGYCAICSTKLLKTKVMPKSGKKKKLIKIIKRKKGRIKGLGSA